MSQAFTLSPEHRIEVSGRNLFADSAGQAFSPSFGGSVPSTIELMPPNDDGPLPEHGSGPLSLAEQVWRKPDAQFMLSCAMKRQLGQISSVGASEGSSVGRFGLLLRSASVIGRNCQSVSSALSRCQPCMSRSSPCALRSHAEARR